MLKNQSHPTSLHYRPSIFYLSLYLLVILLSQFIVSNIFHPKPAVSQQKVPAWITFTNAKDHYRLSYPPTWTINASDSDIDLSAPNSKFIVHLKVIKNHSQPQSFIKNLEKSPYYIVNSQSPLSIGKLSTLELADKSTNPQQTQYFLYAYHENSLYQVTFISDSDDYTATVNKILSTLTPLTTTTPSP